MSRIKLSESNGHLTLSLDKSNPEWSKLNELVQRHTSGTWNESMSCWSIPRTDIKAVKDILNQMVPDDNDDDNASDSSGDEGYATDTGNTDIDESNINNTDNDIDNNTTKNSDIDATDEDDVVVEETTEDTEDTDDNNDDDTGARSDKPNSGNTGDSTELDNDDDNVFDCITDDARLARIKKIMKHVPFQYYAKNNLTRNEFRYLMKICETQ